MKKLLKILVTLSLVGCLCALGALKDTGAATIYTDSARSDTHIHKGVSQYYTVTAEIKVIGSSTSFQDYTASWKSYGTGSYTVNHGNVTIAQHGDGYKKFRGTSMITVGTVFSSKDLTAKISY